jgi:hypothetical protein
MKMKIKQFLHITNLDSFLKGNYSDCFNLDAEDCSYMTRWHSCGEIEFEVDIDSNALVLKTIGIIDDEMKAQRAQYSRSMEVLEQRKSELLSLPAPDSGTEADRIKNLDSENKPLEGLDPDDDPNSDWSGIDDDIPI